MIVFKRLNGKTIALNPDLIERVESTPDTVVTLVDDKKFLVAESLEEVLALITDYRAYIITRSHSLAVVDESRPTLHVVPNEIVASSHVTEADLIATAADDDADDVPPEDDDGAAVVEYLLEATRNKESS